MSLSSYDFTIDVPRWNCQLRRNFMKSFDCHSELKCNPSMQDDDVKTYILLTYVQRRKKNFKKTIPSSSDEDTKSSNHSTPRKDQILLRSCSRRFYVEKCPVFKSSLEEDLPYQSTGIVFKKWHLQTFAPLPRFSLCIYLWLHYCVCDFSTTTLSRF